MKENNMSIKSQSKTFKALQNEFGFDYIVNQTFDSDEFNEYDIIDQNDNSRKVCYVIEFFKSPIDNTILDFPAFEVYYDNENETSDYSNDEFTSSYVTDEFEDMIELVCTALSW